MLSTAAPTVPRQYAGVIAAKTFAAADDNRRASQHIADTLKLMHDRLAPQRRMVRLRRHCEQPLRLRRDRDGHR